MPDLPSDVPSEKSRGAALALASLLGVFGLHRFYAGKTGTGLLMLATLGGAGDPQTAPASTEALAEEVDALRVEIAGLAERLDFAERLLAQPRTPDSPPLPGRRS